MKKPDLTASDYIEDIPTLSARFTTQRAILNAITQAKITEGTYKPEKFFCQLPSSAVPMIHIHRKIKKDEN